MKIIIKQGQSLWEALKEQQIVLDRPCGGRGICRACEVVIEGIGRVATCQFAEEGVYQVSFPKSAAYDIVQTGADALRQEDGDALAPGDTRNKTVGNDCNLTQKEGRLYFAVDVGTTTVAIRGICDTNTRQDGFMNPQRIYGADVISRIQAANAGHGQELQAMIKTRLLESLERLRTEMNPDARHCRVIIAANTTMLHLLRGFSCEGLGCAPFTPVDLSVGEELWKTAHAEYEVTFLPGISAYVGADIVSGIYALHMAESAEVSLLLDLGTNGEMVLGNSQRLLCASAAAGPAFEGGRLALMLHASGILGLLNRMRRQGVMDEYGLLADPYFEEGYPFDCSGLSGTDNSASGEEQRITQDEIRELQMAKGAIRAGIHILLKEYGISAKDVDHIYLAGGMGYYLHPEDAIGIGLLPREFEGRIQAAGNTAILGICRMAQGERREALQSLTEIASGAQELILAEHPDFEEEYISAMNFTDSGNTDSRR